MKRFLLVFYLVVSGFILNAQITWDGGGDGISWDDANNWAPNGVPAPADNVLLDNSIVLTNYTVNLPSIASTTSINTVTITPSAGIIIQLAIPATNTADPGLSVTGPGDAFILNNGAVLMNSTGAGSGGTGLSITNTFRINNGGKYVHNNIRGVAAVVSQLSVVAGTETGIFEYDIPGAVSFAVSLSGRTYGTLIFSAVAAGTARTYTGNGASDLTVRGDLIINSNATLSSTMTANIRIAGNLTITGTFDNSPPSSAMSGRSILLNGTTNQIISGAGNFTFGTNFRNIEVSTGATVTLQRGINLPHPNNTFVVTNGGTLQMAENIINGGGKFQLLSGGWLGIGSPDGIAFSGPSGNVQTTTRSFAAASYEYNGGPGVTQVTGLGLPTLIERTLKINNNAGLGTSGVTLSRATNVSGELALTNGKLTTANTKEIRLEIGGILTTAYSDLSWVNGPMYKEGNTSFIFPIGKGVSIHPAGIVMVCCGNPNDVIKAEYFNSGPSCSPNTPTGGIDHISGFEYWAINRASIFASATKIRLYATTYSQATDRSKLVIARCVNATGWTNFGNEDLVTTGFSGPVTSSLTLSATFNSLFTLASIDPSPTNPLPINLISFDAIKLANTKSSINWELAAYCSASAKFEIEKANGSNRSFSKIAAVNGSTTNKLYNYIDNDLKNGVNYYRLKMIDEDGKITYSRIVAVMNGVNGLMLTSLIPTIITNTATLTIASSNQQKLDIVIVDMQGRAVLKRNYTIAAGNTNIELSLIELAAGLYQLSGINADGKTNTIRFIK